MPNKVALNAVMATLAAAMRHSPAFDIVVVAQVDNNGDLTLMTLPNELLDHQQILASSINFSDCGSITGNPELAPMCL